MKPKLNNQDMRPKGNSRKIREIALKMENKLTVPLVLYGQVIETNENAKWFR